MGKERGDLTVVEYNELEMPPKQRVAEKYWS